MELKFYSKTPIPGCPKNMYNGPCGGGSGGVCEATRRECSWVKRFLENPIDEVFENVILDSNIKIVSERSGKTPRYSGLLKKLDSGAKVLTYEYVAGFQLDVESFRSNLKMLSRYYDAVNFVDSPLGLPHVDPLALSIEAVRAGVEPVLQISCKGKSRGEIVSKILAASRLGVKNVLGVTGDWPLLGDRGSTPIFDLDAVRLIYLARVLRDLGVDYSGRKIGSSLEYNIGTSFNPYFEPIQLEVKRVSKKIYAGAEYLVSQPIFHLEILKKFINHSGNVLDEVFIIPSIIHLPNLKLIPKLEDFARVKVSEDYVYALRGGRLTHYLGGFVEELLSLEGVCGVHVLTLGDHNAGLSLGEIIARL